MLGIIKAIVKGVVAGAIASFVGYAKKEEVPKWDLKKMLQTVILGAITTGIVNGSGMPISDLSVEIAVWLDIPAVTSAMVEFAILTGIIILVDHVVKIIVRRTDVMELWNKFKEFISKYVHK